MKYIILKHSTVDCYYLSGYRCNAYHRMSSSLNTIVFNIFKTNNENWKRFEITFVCSDFLRYPDFNLFLTFHRVNQFHPWWHEDDNISHVTAAGTPRCHGGQNDGQLNFQLNSTIQMTFYLANWPSAHLYRWNMIFTPICFSSMDKKKFLAWNVTSCKKVTDQRHFFFSTSITFENG